MTLDAVAAAAEEGWSRWDEKGEEEGGFVPFAFDEEEDEEIDGGHLETEEDVEGEIEEAEVSTDLETEQRLHAHLAFASSKLFVIGFRGHASPSFLFVLLLNGF